MPRPGNSSTRVFSQSEAFEIINQASLRLAEMLPGCTARRYDLPPAPGMPWGVTPCFADCGPIAPALFMRPSKYFSGAHLALHYQIMLRDPYDLGAVFIGEIVPVYVLLDDGPEAVANTFYEAIAKMDLAGLIAAGTIDHILSSYERHPVPWPNFNLALCAAYLGRDDQARDLLRDALSYARQDGRSGYTGLIAEIQSCMVKLNSSPGGLSSELKGIVADNWMHFKPINLL